MTGLDDLHHRISALRGARGARRYYGDTFDEGVLAALDQLCAWVASLDKPLPGHPDADRGMSLAEQADRVPPRLLRRVRQHDDD